MPETKGIEGHKISIIGAGTMGKALIKGMLKGEVISPKDIIATRRSEEELSKLVKEFYGVDTTTDNKKAVTEADVIILAVEPQNIFDVLVEISNAVDSSKLIISIAAGIKIQTIQSQLKDKAHIIRAMPNTPIRVGEGAIAISKGKNASEKDVDLAEKIFKAVGEVEMVAEEKMDAVTGLSGSGPAYIFLIIDALSNAGLKVGLPWKTSLNLSVQTVLGAAKMLKENGKDPAELQDEVTSPHGTTIAGLDVLEECGIRLAIIKAVEEATKRSHQLGEAKS